MTDDFEMHLSRRLVEPAPADASDITDEVHSGMRRDARRRQRVKAFVAATLVIIASATGLLGFWFVTQAIAVARLGVIWLPLGAAGVLLALVVREALLAIARP